MRKNVFRTGRQNILQKRFKGSYNNCGKKWNSDADYWKKAENESKRPQNFKNKKKGRRHSELPIMQLKRKWVWKK